MATYKISKQTKRKSTGRRPATTKVNSDTLRATSQVVDIGGNIINKTEQRYKYIIYSRLNAAGYEINTNTNFNEAAKDLLRGVFKCTTSEGVLDNLTDTDRTMVENPNIENNLEGKKGEPVSATDKFIDVEGSFYNLDQAMPRNVHEENQKEEAIGANNYIMLASRMAMTSMAKGPE